MAQRPVRAAVPAEQFHILASSVRGYLPKSSPSPNCVGLTKMVTIVSSHSRQAASTRLTCPACRAPWSARLRWSGRRDARRSLLDEVRSMLTSTSAGWGSGGLHGVTRGSRRTETCALAVLRSVSVHRRNGRRNLFVLRLPIHAAYKQHWSQALAAGQSPASRVAASLLAASRFPRELIAALLGSANAEGGVSSTTSSFGDTARCLATCQAWTNAVVLVLVQFDSSISQALIQVKIADRQRGRPRPSVSLQQAGEAIEELYLSRKTLARRIERATRRAIGHFGRRRRESAQQRSAVERICQRFGQRRFAAARQPEQSHICQQPNSR